MRVAFFVNPIAGYGLLDNRKDSANIEEFDFQKSISAKRAREFLSLLDRKRIELIVPEGVMGTEVVGQVVSVHKVSKMHVGSTDAEDTRRFVKSLNPNECDILVFVGGDGTARDVLASIHSDIPVLGVPSGLKMYSGVFAQDPQKAALIVNNFDPATTRFTEADVLDMDINDPGKRVEQFGVLRIPLIEGIVSQGKTEYSEYDTEDLIDFVLETLEDGRYYFISTGHTCKSVMKRLGYDTNPLGIDLIKNGKLVEEDLDRARILHYASLENCSLVVSPLGGQNFLFGRGNRQIDGSVIEAIGFENVIIIAGTEKMMECRDLLVDLPGSNLPDFVRVISGYGRYRIVPLRK